MNRAESYQHHFWFIKLPCHKRHKLVQTTYIRVTPVVLLPCILEVCRLVLTPALSVMKTTVVQPQFPIGEGKMNFANFKKFSVYCSF